ncbi:hypothetical protein ACFL2B_02930 [Patescibacteria group bacterium]
MAHEELESIGHFYGIAPGHVMRGVQLNTVNFKFDTSTIRAAKYLMQFFHFKSAWLNFTLPAWQDYCREWLKEEVSIKDIDCLLFSELIVTQNAVQTPPVYRPTHRFICLNYLYSESECDPKLVRMKGALEK